MTIEDTQTNEALIEEMLRDAENAPEPGTLEKVIHKGDEEQPAPMTLAKLESAGWVYIYETKDGQRSIANKGMLRQLLKLKNKDGTPRFTVNKPPYEPKRGTLKCLLHGDNPDRAHYSELGLPVCPKSNITNPLQVKRHMQKRHPVEWATLEQERIERERQEDKRERKEDRELQHAILKATKPELYVSKRDRAKEE